MKKSLAQRTQDTRQELADDLRDRKRERILEVAEDLFFRQGYAGTTIADIVAALGVTKPFLYYYFHNKSEIFETLCWRASCACLTALHFDDSDRRSAAEKLREGLHRFAAANVDYFKSGTFAYREANALSPALVKKLRALARRFYDDLRSLLDAGRKSGDFEFDDTKLTALAIGSVAGFMYTWYKPGGDMPPDVMAEELTNILLKIAGDKTGARKRPSPRSRTRST
ncbi:TetR/AcrR family transcriptional regulator [Oxalobacteraceae bacterium OM1]|nr:TetR/AcrR family transcriptional regulator [Oxalobacteraceae bacterium OM1]